MQNVKLDLRHIYIYILYVYFSIVIFRNQGVVNGKRHVEISEWFGPCDSTFYKHPKSPHDDVFRVSNDEHEGCLGVGRTGWHVDGSFQPAPFSYSLYHMAHVPKKGDTGIHVYNNHATNICLCKLNYRVFIFQ